MAEYMETRTLFPPSKGGGPIEGSAYGQFGPYRE